MSVTVRYFGGLRERLETSEETLEMEALPPNATVADALAALGERHPLLDQYRRHVRIALNQDFVDESARLTDGDELAFIPPVSGGSESLSDPSGRFLITTRPLDPVSVTDSIRRPEAGAVITFEGTVRNFTADYVVEYLEYEAYVEMALKKLEETAAKAGERWPEVQVAVHHRYGRLEIGETAVVIAVSAPHRAEAYAASQYVIDRLKKVVPIWKKEVTPEGEEWVGFGP